MMKDGTCTIPCYEEDEDCNLTVVKIFVAKNSDSKEDPPVLYKLNPIMWHGLFTDWSLIWLQCVFFVKEMVHHEIEQIKQ